MPPERPVPARAGVRRLGSGSVLWRVTVMLALAAVLLAGQLQRTNEYFPFGTLEQYAQAEDPDGQVRSTCLLGERDGQVVDIGFGRRSVGIERADVENHLTAMRADPSLLAPLAEHYDREHPGLAPLTALVVCQRVTTLRHGAPAGPAETVQIVRWTAP